MQIYEMRMVTAPYPLISLDSMLWLFLSAFCSPWLLCCFKRRTFFEKAVDGLLFNTLPPKFGLISAYTSLCLFSPFHCSFYVKKLIILVSIRSAVCVYYWDTTF